MKYIKDISKNALFPRLRRQHRAHRDTIKSLLYLWMVVLSSTMPCYAQSVVVFSPDLKPPKYYMENGQEKGILIEMTRWIGEAMGQEFDFQLMPWKRAYFNAVSGHGGVIGLSKNQERLKIFDFSDVMYYDDILVAVRKEKTFPFSSINDLKGKRIAVLRGASNGDEMDNLLNSDKVIVFKVNSYVQVLKMVLSGHADTGLVGPGKIGFNIILERDNKLKLARDQITVLDKPAVRDANYFGIAKSLNAQKFVQKFNQALKQGHETGVFDSIIQKYESHAISHSN